MTISEAGFILAINGCKYPRRQRKHMAFVGKLSRKKMRWVSMFAAGWLCIWLLQVPPALQEAPCHPVEAILFPLQDPAECCCQGKDPEDLSHPPCGSHQSCSSSSIPAGEKLFFAHTSSGQQFPQTECPSEKAFLSGSFQNLNPWSYKPCKTPRQVYLLNQILLI